MVAVRRQCKVDNLNRNQIMYAKSLLKRDKKKSNYLYSLGLL